MSDEMKNRYIEYLIEHLEDTDLDNRAMKLVLEDLTLESSQYEKKQSEILDKLNDLQSMLAEEHKTRKLIERENQQLKERLKSSRKERFGSKKQSAKEDDSERGYDTPDRQDEKDSFDRTDESLSPRSVPDPDALVSETSSRQPPRDLSNRPEVYLTMGVNGTPVQHPSDLSKVPSRILSRKKVKTFRLNVCFAHLRAKFVKAA